MLLGRAAIACTAAAAGLLLVEDWWRVLAVVASVAAGTVAEVSVLTRWPAVTRHPWPALAVDLAVAVAVLVLSRGGMAFFCYAAGSAALGGALLGSGRCRSGRRRPRSVRRRGCGPAGQRPAAGRGRVPRRVPDGRHPRRARRGGRDHRAQRHLDLSVEVVGAAQRSAAASERARLARELHDSVRQDAARGVLRRAGTAAVAAPAPGPGRAARRHRLARARRPPPGGPASSSRGCASDAARPGLRRAPCRVICTALERDRRRIPVRVDLTRSSRASSARYELVRILARGAAQRGPSRRARHATSRSAAGPAAALELTGPATTARIHVPEDLVALQAGGHLGMRRHGRAGPTVGGSPAGQSAVPGRGTDGRGDHAPARRRWTARPSDRRVRDDRRAHRRRQPGRARRAARRARRSATTCGSSGRPATAATRSPSRCGAGPT